MSETIKKPNKNDGEQKPVRIREYAEFYYECGIDNLYEYGNYCTAIGDFSRAIEINPKYAEAYFERGFAHYKNEDYKEAIADFTTAIGLNPNDDDYYYWRTVAIEEWDDYQGMIAKWDEIKELNPDDFYYYFSRAEFRVKIGDFQGAIADYNSAIGIEPSRYFLYTERGDNHMAMKNYQAAYDDYSIAVKGDPLNYGNKEKLEKARAMLRASEGIKHADSADCNNAFCMGPFIFMYQTSEDARRIEQKYAPLDENSIWAGPYSKRDKYGFVISED